MSLEVIDAPAVRRWLDAARAALARSREEIDALNVYPVPDGDTGTNLCLTLDAANESLEALPERTDLVGTLRELSRGLLMGARGNSGVILSQLVRGLAEVITAATADGRAVDGSVLKDALGRAADQAYAAVARPVEGTILSVARAAEQGARSAPGTDLAEVAEAAARSAWSALARTPDQLEALRLAGVVDAGGRGLCELLDALVATVTGVAVGSAVASAAATRRPHAAQEWDGQECDDVGPAFEVMYLLDAPDEGVPALRTALDALGDSVVVVGGEGLWNVHAHVDDVGAAVEAGLAVGRPHRIRVTHLAVASGRNATAGGTRATSAQHLAGRPAGSTGVVAVVAGAGLASLCRAAGAVVVHGEPGHRASTAEVLGGIRRTGTAEVVVLPNDADSLAVAEVAAAAAREEGLRVAVIPTRASVQGLAALAVHEPRRRFDDDVVLMSAAAGHTRHGGVTIAARDAVTMAGVCRVGDVLGVIDGDFAVIGDDLAATAVTVVERLLSGGGELLTLLVGQDGSEADAAVVVEAVRRSHPEVETVVLDGGQARYPLLVGLE